MVIVGLSSGLASQMYEYAAAYALARELKQEWMLDISECIKASRRYQTFCGYSGGENFLLIEFGIVLHHFKLMNGRIRDND